MSANAAIWVRVSTDRQHEDNQIPDLERLCQHRGWEITRRYEIADASATKASTAKRCSECSRTRTAASSPCSSSGPSTDSAAKASRSSCDSSANCASATSRSSATKKPWLNGTDSTTELLAAVAAWVATQEVRPTLRADPRQPRARKAEGKPIGGAASKRGKDKRPRETEGYKQGMGTTQSSAVA